MYTSFKINAEVQMERIRQLRKERGLSQVKLAVMADMDPATLNRLERGTGNPNLKTLERVADALGVEAADFFPKGTRRSSPEPSLFIGLEDERHLLDYRKCREALDRFCDYWEQALDEDRLDRRACEEFNRGAQLTSKLLVELWRAEKVELRIQRGEDPQTVDKSEPWPPGLMEKSELSPAIDRWMLIGRRLVKILKERFGEEAATGTGVAELREYARRKAG
jgi:transcriptional regulator with XRE-family HTH domain